MPMVFKAWEDLTIRDNYMFQRVMRDKQLCKQMLEEILEQPIRDIHYMETELTLQASYASRGARLDVYIEDEANTIYDVEMQVRNDDGDALPQRMRYYQSQIDAEILAKGADFSDLRKTLIIFICPFDPIGRNWHLYKYENLCVRDPSLHLNDGAEKIILNTKGEGEHIAPQLQAFMNYVNGVASLDPFVQALDHRLNEVKRNEQERVSYMTYLANIRHAEKKAREEGREEGRVEGIEMMMHIWDMLRAKVSYENIAIENNLSVEEVRRIAEKYNLSY